MQKPAGFHRRATYPKKNTNKCLYDVERFTIIFLAIMVHDLLQMYHNSMSLCLLIAISTLLRAVATGIRSLAVTRPHRDGHLRIEAFVFHGAAYNNI